MTQTDTIISLRFALFSVCLLGVLFMLLHATAGYISETQPGNIDRKTPVCKTVQTLNPAVSGHLDTAFVSAPPNSAPGGIPLPFALSKPGRLVEAVYIAVEEARADAYEKLECSPAQNVGKRTRNHPPNLMGTACEPWINRVTATVLSHYLTDSSMVGLEWSSGSSTVWLLRRLGALFSCEHCFPWLKVVEQTIDKELPWRRPAWESVHVPCAEIVEGACSGACGVNEDPGTNYTDYVLEPAKRFLEKAPRGFDFVSVDGRARQDCLMEVVNSRLLKERYGVLMLDNAERRIYHATTAQLPKHWICVSFANSVDETALWMSCPVEDEYCKQAQAEIDVLMLSVPLHQGVIWKQKVSRAAVA